MNSKKFINDIIDGMYDWVRVLDRDDNIIYINKAMADGLNGYPIGEKCYTVIGRNRPCENCISRKAVFKGEPLEKEEIINGKIFSVMSSPVKNSQGEIIAVVEVLRDITQLKQLQKKIIDQNSKLQEDLTFAKKLQLSLLPQQLPDKRVGLSFVYQPCEDLGGDLIDMFSLDENHLGLYIADVSGHGVPASMLTVFLRTSMDKTCLSPAQALNKLFIDFNKMHFSPDLYITVFYVIIDLESKRLTYSNAGHNMLPIVFSENRFELLRAAGIPISDWQEAPDYRDFQIQFNEGDKLFMYTDGIAEIRNNSNEQFGEERLLNVLLANNAAPDAALDRLLEEACSFAGINPGEVPDDITMALLEIK